MNVCKRDGAEARIRTWELTKRQAPEACAVDHLATSAGIEQKVN